MEDSVPRAEYTAEMQRIWGAMENRVTYKAFTWVIGILMMIVIGMLGYLIMRVDNISQRVDPMVTFFEQLKDQYTLEIKQ